MSTIEDVADLDVPLPSSLAQKNEKRKTNYKEVLSIQSDLKTESHQTIKMSLLVMSVSFASFSYN